VKDVKVFKSLNSNSGFLAKNYTHQELLPAIISWQLASVEVE